MIRRGIGPLLLAVILAGCVSQQAQVVGGPDAASFRVTDVTVEAARAASTTPRGFNLPEDVTERLLRAQVFDLLDDVNVDADRPVTVEVIVTRIFVANPGSAVIGRSGSVAEATAQIIDVESGAALGPPFEVSGGTGTRLGGVIGAAVTTGVLANGGERAEMSRVGRGLGRVIARAIFGIDPAV